MGGVWGGAGGRAAAGRAVAGCARGVRGDRDKRVLELRAANRRIHRLEAEMNDTTTRIGSPSGNPQRMSGLAS